MKIYIDFDGVILDTDEIINKEFKKEKNISKKEFVMKYNWNELLKKSKIINNSLENIKNSKYDISLLSKISSLNEGIEKIKYLRENDIKININLVPAEFFKNEIVNAKDNILIDDKVYNLEKWEEAGGIPIFFNKNNKNFDIYNKENIKYKKIDNLKILLQNDLKIFTKK